MATRNRLPCFVCTALVYKDSGEIVKVRLWGADSNENHNPRSQEAARFTRAVALGQSVRVEVKNQDRHG